MFICCNDLPKIPSIDQGTWRRLRVIQFPSKFVDNPNPKKKNEFKKNVDLERNLDNYINSFMNLLLHYYEKYKNNNFMINEPEEVKLSTQSYKNVNDDIEIYLNENVEYSEDSQIDLKILFTNFKYWYSRNFNGKCKNITKFKEILHKKDLVDKKSTFLVNYKFKEGIIIPEN
jgi:putative DNA primase/helicase